MHDDAQNKRTTKSKKEIFLDRYTKLMLPNNKNNI
jgi:hypothetical protein